MAIDPASQLRLAVEAGCAEGVSAALAAGASPNSDGPNSVYYAGQTALQYCAIRGHVRCAEALLAAGADPAAADAGGWAALHYAATVGSLEVIALLLEAAPELALQKDGQGRRPLDVAIQGDCYNAARLLLERGTLPPAGEVLALLERTPPEWFISGCWIYLDWPFDNYLVVETEPVPLTSLYAALAARQPLTPAEWARVPGPGLRAALPAVLARSEAEAALLVRCLPAADRERLRTAALCLSRAQRRHRTPLPSELLHPLLFAAVAD